MDVDWAKFWLDLFIWAVAMAIAIGAWIRSGNKRNQTSINGFQEELHLLDKRVQSVEALAKAAPTHNDITELREQTAELGSKLDGMQNTLDLIHGYLLNKKD
ncbi:MAG: hypothetical protein K6L74_06635 [Neptuniibacter sp.]